MKTLFSLFIAFTSAYAALKQVVNVGDKKYFVGADVNYNSSYQTWKNASNFCKQNNLTLATINNKAEQDALIEWRRSFRVFIGATKTKDSKVWVWESTGKPVTFTNWHFPADHPYFQTDKCSSMIGLKPEEDFPYLLPTPELLDSPLRPVLKHGDWQASCCDDEIGQALCEMV